MSLSWKVLRRTWEDPQGCPEVSEMDLMGRCYDRWTDCTAQMAESKGNVSERTSGPASLWAESCERGIKSLEHQLRASVASSRDYTLFELKVSH